MSKIETVYLGNSSLHCGAIAYGNWRFAGTDVETARRKIVAALEAGMTLIDTADIYGTGEAGHGSAEALLGEVLRKDRSLRDRMVLATKSGVDLGTPYDNSRSYILDACEASMQRLGVDVIDLYQVHRRDLMVGAAELAGTLDILVDSGKVRYVGLSNVTAAQARAIAAHMEAAVTVIQNEFSVFEQSPINDGILDFCEETGASFLAWSPFAGGRVFSAPEDPAEAEVQEALVKIAKAHDASPDEVALAFLRQHPAGVVPIIGTQNVSRIRALGERALPVLSRREWYDLVEARRGAAMP